MCDLQMLAYLKGFKLSSSLQLYNFHTCARALYCKLQQHYQIAEHSITCAALAETALNVNGSIMLVQIIDNELSYGK